MNKDKDIERIQYRKEKLKNETSFLTGEEKVLFYEEIV